MHSNEGFNVVADRTMSLYENSNMLIWIESNWITGIVDPRHEVIALTIFMFTEVNNIYLFIDKKHFCSCQLYNPPTFPLNLTS